MSYANEADLQARLGPELLALLADEDGDGSPDPSLLLVALEDASAEIDAALSGRYATPIDPAPPSLKRLAVDLAVHLLFSRRREAISDEHLERWRVARALLERIARGQIELDGAQSRLRGLKTESTTLERKRHFDRDALDSF
jgi:phage gp36-like protein